MRKRIAYKIYNNRKREVRCKTYAIEGQQKDVLVSKCTRYTVLQIDKAARKVISCHLRYIKNLRRKFQNTTSNPNHHGTNPNRKNSRPPFGA